MAKTSISETQRMIAEGYRRSMARRGNNNLTFRETICVSAKSAEQKNRKAARDRSRNAA